MRLIQTEIKKGLACPGCGAPLSASGADVRGDNTPRLELVCGKCHATVLRAELVEEADDWRY